MKKVFTKDETKDIAKKVLSSIKKTSDTALIFAFSGDLGAGKTTLSQSIAQELGVKENVISPTFVIMKSYKINHSDFEQLIHIDAYRLNSSRELEILGWQEIISNPKNLIIIEWPEKVADILPKNTKNIKLSHISENEREIECP